MVSHAMPLRCLELFPGNCHETLGHHRTCTRAHSTTTSTMLAVAVWWGERLSAERSREAPERLNRHSTERKWAYHDTGECNTYSCAFSCLRFGQCPTWLRGLGDEEGFEEIFGLNSASDKSSQVPRDQSGTENLNVYKGYRVEGN